MFVVGINFEFDFILKKWIEGCNVNLRMGFLGVFVVNCRMWCKYIDFFFYLKEI